jgi:hypothetical protein
MDELSACARLSGFFPLVRGVARLDACELESGFALVEHQFDRAVCNELGGCAAVCGEV